MLNLAAFDWNVVGPVGGTAIAMTALYTGLIWRLATRNGKTKDPKAEAAPSAGSACPFPQHVADLAKHEEQGRQAAANIAILFAKYDNLVDRHREVLDRVDALIRMIADRFPRTGV